MDRRSENIFTSLITAFVAMTMVLVTMVVVDLSQDDDESVSGAAPVAASTGSSSSATESAAAGSSTAPGEALAPAPSGTTVETVPSSPGVASATPSFSSPAPRPSPGVGRSSSGAAAPAAAAKASAPAAGGQAAPGPAPAAQQQAGTAPGQPVPGTGAVPDTGAGAAPIGPSDAAVPPKEERQGVTPTEILVGTSTARAGSVAFPAASDFAAAYLKMVNDQGGVNGRKFKYVVYDNDATDTNQALANVKRLNEVDKYFAQVGGGNPFADPMYPYMEEHGVPVVGEMAEISQVYRRKNTFPTGNYVSVQCRAIGDYAAKKLGWKKVGTVATNVYISQDCKSGFTSAIKKNGGTITYASETPLGTPDYTSEAIRMRQSGAEAVAIAHTGAAATAFMQAAQRQGWRPEKGYASCSPCYAQSIAKDAAEQSEGAVFAMAGRLWTSSNPGAQTMVSAVKKYVNNPSWDGGGLPAWSGTNLFIDALKAIGNDITRSRVMGWIGAQQAWKAAGDFTLPLDFTTKGPNEWYRTPLDSVILGQVKNGDLHELTTEWVPDPGGGDPTPNLNY